MNEQRPVLYGRELMPIRTGSFDVIANIVDGILSCTSIVPCMISFWEEPSLMSAHGNYWQEISRNEVLSLQEHENLVPTAMSRRLPQTPNK
jgi:hypothetical protein